VKRPSFPEIPPLRAAALPVAFVCALALGSGAARADEPAATPYRPTVSNPAALPVPGFLEVEAGWQRTNGGDDAHRASIPWLLKYAFSDRFGVLVGGESALAVTDAGSTAWRGEGDTSLILKFSYPVNDWSALGLEAGRKFPTAARGFGSGEADDTLNGIYSVQLGDFSIDANLNVARLGASDPGQSRQQYGWATAVSHPLGEKWGAALELSGTRRDGAGTTRQVLAAASYNLSRRIVLDAGTARGLNRASPNSALFSGITVLFD
jgi:hypothetical protein